MRGLIALSVLPLLASSAPTLNTETIHSDAAPLLTSSNAEVVPDSYIVVFKKHVSESSASDHHSWVQNIHSENEGVRTELRKRSQFPITTDIFEGLKHTYNIGAEFLGYSGHFDDEVIEQVRRHPDVEYVEKDSVVHALGDTGELEKNAPWGLARISHRDSLGFSDFNKYLYAADAGEGVDVYVIDTGTNTEHVDFEGRAHWGKTIPLNDPDEDGNGHGTHCSGTVAGHKYGVAKKANVYAVKVLKSNGSGTMADVVKGVEWAANSHIEKAKKGKKGFKGSTANMSLGGSKSPALDRAVNGAVDAGIHFAVAAGNDNADSCNYSPAAADKAITVGASALDDSRAYFSNFGPCNDIFAPGLSIQSTWIGSKYAVNTISGTSMASPHIAGLLAYYLSLQPSSDSAYAVEELTPKKLKETIISVATKGALSDVPSNTENVLAWNGGGSSNYSSIINAGGYSVKKSTKAPAKLPTTIELLEEAIENDFNMISGEIVKDTKAAVYKAEKISSKVEKMVEQELSELFDELDM
ncbi:putative subtilisin-like proteinase Spm1 [Amylocarpus encephaloides]|uniref:Subtilisin-like proteinase Spm1 n=1 Tax=Amylocarpus encephaloides TaxID=45428 RepID=A0A9P8C8N8_9HELO|nr:putative subtilisin-like proteinase Spm1 [Amylocarpus encephaloides]